jgi:putative N-acetylmannosamine-6-phosphate epimerase
MKTTIDLSDALMLEAKAQAAAHQTTLRAMMEEGLQHVLERMKKPKPFVLKDCSFKGEGLQPGQENLSWDEVMAMCYGDRY